ncbi:thiamine-phosphate pyrophosphorylase [bacterium]|nr:thiamine-phosphate pyrophosphorylase [bacterium]MBU1958311.1 thiamine-phosphate pyrophosphorylase [bacterium]
MTNHSQSLENNSPKIERLIDANLNRLKEGLRVIEDICRYIHNDTILTPQIKTLRHQLKNAYNKERLSYRDIEGDTQKTSTKSELTRSSLDDLVIANFSRAQESSRVLEESFKLKQTELSELFKQIRYQLYAIEKNYFAQY